MTLEQAIKACNTCKIAYRQAFYQSNLGVIRSVRLHIAALWPD